MATDPGVLAEEWARKVWPGPDSLIRSAAVEAFIAGWEARDQEGMST